VQVSVWERVAAGRRYVRAGLCFFHSYFLFPAPGTYFKRGHTKWLGVFPDIKEDEGWVDLNSHLFELTASHIFDR